MLPKSLRSYQLILAVCLVVLTLVGIPSSVFLFKSRLQPGPVKESGAENKVVVYLSPASHEFKVGQKIQTNVFFNTRKTPISSIALRISYPYSGTKPEIETSQIEINRALLTDGYWSCPTKTISLDGENAEIDIACLNNSPSGFTTTNDTLLASFTLEAITSPADNPVILSFDTSQSTAAHHLSGQVLPVLASTTGSYLVASTKSSSSPATLGAINDLDLSRSDLLADTGYAEGEVLSSGFAATTTATPTPTLTVAPTATPATTASPAAQLMESGFFLPIFSFVGAAGLLLLMAGILVL